MSDDMKRQIFEAFALGYPKDIREMVEKANALAGREDFRFRAFQGSVSSKNVKTGTPYKTADQDTHAWGVLSYYTTGAPSGAAFQEDGIMWRVIKVRFLRGNAMMYSDLHWLAQRVEGDEDR